jgi:hypothetical protein
MAVGDQDHGRIAVAVTAVLAGARQRYEANRISDAAFSRSLAISCADSAVDRLIADH